MKLNFIERFTVLDLVPKKANFVMLKQYRLLKEKVSLQSDEVKEFSVKLVGENMTWDNTKDSSKEIEFNDIETDIIVKELRLLDESNKLEDKHYSLYEKFINKK